MKNLVSQIPLRLALCGLSGMLVSLLMPAVRVFISGPSEICKGWQAIICAVMLGFEAVMDLGATHSQEDMLLIVLGLAGISNIVFIAVPIVLMRGTSSKAMKYWLGGISLVGLILGVASPYTVSEKPAMVFTGYYVWLLSYVVLLSAILSSIPIFRKRGESSPCGVDEGIY